MRTARFLIAPVTAAALALSLGACGSGGGGSDASTIKVAYQKFGNFTQADELFKDVKADYDSLRARHAAKNDRPLATLAAARAARTPIEWDGYRPPRPRLLVPRFPSGTHARRNPVMRGDGIYT